MTDRLIEIIGREAALFECFLELLEQQQQSLIANDIKGLAAVAETMREKMVENQLLNQQREEAVAAIKVANAIEGDLNVTRLLDIVDRQQADRLQHLRQVILSLHDKIAETRNRNALLINRSREFVGRTVEMLSRLSGPDGMYRADGTDHHRHQAIAVDRRA